LPPGPGPNPNPRSFTASAAKVYADTVMARGDTVVMRDLYAMGFDPVLRTGEIPRPGGFQPGADVVAERAVLEDVDVFALVYPLWFNTPPAILKGYVERVFSMGFGFGPGPGGNAPLLQGRKLISVSLSGAPEHWVHETRALDALMTVFDLHLAAMCGLQMIDHIHIGEVRPLLNPEAAEVMLGDLANRVRAHFDAAPEELETTLSTTGARHG
jgi:NAD(P)H dehydrogenase (quinone)